MRVEVQDAGEYYKVVDVYLGIHEKMKPRGLSFMFNNLNLYRYLKYKLKNNESVFMLKDIDKININYFVSGKDGMETYRKLSVKKVKNILINREKMPILFYLYIFESLSNILKSNGFNINNTNKEDIYLDILSAGDDDMIEILQQYLEVQALIEEFLSIYSKTLDNINNIYKSETSSDINKIIDDFFTEYN